MPLLRQLRRDLQAFVTGQDHAFLALHAAREHLGYVYMLLGEMEGASKDVFLSFPQRFTSATDYVDCVEGRIDASLAEAGVVEAPARAGRRARDPAARLQAALIRARESLARVAAPPRLVVTLLPLECDDELGLRALVNGLLALPIGRPPWCAQMRVLVHEVAGDLRGAEALPLVRRLRCDLGLDAIGEAIAVEADDPATPDLRRAQSILQVATMDLGRRRFERADARYHQLLGMPAVVASPALTALALHGLGECERLRGRSDAALEWFERALGPAGRAGVAMILLLVARGLAQLHLEGQRYPEAAVYFEGIARLARTLPEPEAEAAALEQLARCQARLGERAPAATSLLAAARVARDNDRVELVDRLHRELARVDDGALPRALGAEIAAFYQESVG